MFREEENRQVAIRYLLANPVRAGLVSDVRDYPFWGSSVWGRDELLTAFFDTSDSPTSAR